MSVETCTLFSVQRFSTEDGPGIRTTLFFKGCPLSCRWCHNPEGIRTAPEVMWQPSICMGCGDCQSACQRRAIQLADGRVVIDRQRCEACGTCVEACPTGALERVGTTYNLDALLVEVLKDRTFYGTSGGGVTLSGGEPLMQHAFAEALARRCRDEGLHVALDTCGFGRTEGLDAVLEHVDLVLFDLKILDNDAHERLTGAPVDGILDNLARVTARGVPVWVRTPVIPGCTDDEGNLRAIARYLAAHVPTLERYDLLAFSNLCTSKYEMLGRRFPLTDEPLLTRETMERLTALVRAEGVASVRWSGPTSEDRRTKSEERNGQGDISPASGSDAGPGPSACGG